MRRTIVCLNARRLARPRVARSMSTDPKTGTDYTEWSSPDLISRVTTLESQLRQQNARLSELLAASTAPAHALVSSKSPEQPRPTKTKKPVKAFDFSAHPTRHIALKFAYLGAGYNGFEHANGTFTPLPTIEEVLWKALRKARLIDPKTTAEEGEQVDTDYDVVWDTRDRLQKYGKENVKLDINWDDCQYSKCGRTDRGVSAFGQVVGVRVRSKIRTQPAISQETSEGVTGGANGETEQHEFAYASILNSILPPTIRILAVCLDPPDFDARFSCRERRYKYFFTNPAFSPIPGPMGVRDGVRDGWLDIEKMRDAARRLEGLHDFRNFCKVDPSKQNGTHDRRITYAGIEEVAAPLNIFGEEPRLSSGAGSSAINGHAGSAIDGVSGPKVYTFTVHGTAFLWHQVRCMVAILFLVGQGLEDPSVVDQLLDIKGNEEFGRPNYEMADDGPLVLWDCVFGATYGSQNLNWTYVGDAATLPGLTTKTDGMFGLGGLVDECWGMWRKAKIEEALKGQLLGLVLGQGDGSALERGGAKSEIVTENIERSTKVFDGSDKGRLVGRYVKVMQRPKLDSVDVQRAKFANGKLARRELKRGLVEVGKEVNGAA